MATKRYPQAGDYVKTVPPKFTCGEWRGKIRRQDTVTKAFLIEWSYCGGLPTDICTWVTVDDIAITRRPKNSQE